MTSAALNPAGGSGARLLPWLLAGAGLAAMYVPTLVSLFGDLNSDGTVNILDISIVAFAYGSTPGNERWNPEADTNHDGIVNIVDVAQVAREFGKQV